METAASLPRPARLSPCLLSLCGATLLRLSRLDVLSDAYLFFNLRRGFLVRRSASSRSCVIVGSARASIWQQSHVSTGRAAREDTPTERPVTWRPVTRCVNKAARAVPSTTDGSSACFTLKNNQLV